MKNLLIISFFSLLCLNLVGQSNNVLAQQVVSDIEEISNQVQSRNTSSEVELARQAFEKNQDVYRLWVTDLKVDARLIEKTFNYSSEQKQILLHFANSDTNVGPTGPVGPAEIDVLKCIKSIAKAVINGIDCQSGDPVACGAVIGSLYSIFENCIDR